MEDFKFVWKIENFNFLPPQRGKALQSPSFNVHLLGSNYLELYPKGDILDPHDESIIVCLNNCSKLPNTSVKCELQLLTEDYAIPFKTEKIHAGTKWRFTKDLQTLRYGLLSFDSVNYEFSKMTLVVTCRFFLNSDMAKSNKKSAAEGKDMMILSKDMKKLYIDQQFCDITLCTENEKFPAHKAILFARLPKLVSDLESDDGSELKQLTNIEPEVARYLLNYAYSGKLSITDSNIPGGLYSAAQLFDLDDLKQKMYAYSNEVCARTYIRVDHTMFMWPITNIHTMELNKKQYSPAFAGGVIECSDLKLSCYLTQNSEGELSLEVCIHRLFPDKEKPIFVKCLISVSDQITLFRVAEHVFNGDQEWHFPSFMAVKREGKEVLVGPTYNKRGSINSMGHHDIILKCEFSISGSEMSMIEETESSLAKYERFIHYGKDVSNLCTDLGKMYNIFLPKVSDVTLLIGTVRFPAHKAVLAARSPVFSRMFSNDMIESKSGVVKITDIDIAVLNMMLNYIYSAKVDILSFESAIKLYSAADKYEVTALKERCASYMKKFLCDDNVCDVLLLADMHGDADLKSFSKEFIDAHADVILESSQWKNLMDTRIDLASEVLHSLVSTVLQHNRDCGMCSN